MEYLLSIDPGMNWCGAAMFDLNTQKLIKARWFKGAGFKGDMFNVYDIADEVIGWASSPQTISLAVEWPQVYGKTQRGRKDPNDLLPLAALNGAIAALAYSVGLLDDEGHIAVYKPHDWKGSKKKNPLAHMVIDRLSSEERTCIEHFPDFFAALSTSGESECKHPTMNTIDAVGVGLHHLGRLTRRRVVVR